MNQKKKLHAQIQKFSIEFCHSICKRLETSMKWNKFTRWEYNIFMNRSFFVNCQNDEYILFDGVMKTHSFQFEEDGKEHLLSSFPIGGKRLPQSVRVNTLKPQFDGKISVTKWNDAYYELSFAKELQNEKMQTQIVEEQNFSYQGRKYWTGFTEDIISHFIIESDRNSLHLDFEEHFENPSLNVVTLSTGVLVSMLAEGEKQKLLIVALVDDKINLLFKTIADEIEFFEGQFVVREKLLDMIGRVKKTSYVFDNLTREMKLKSIDFEYENNRAYRDELLPYLFLEAIEVQDFQKANECLVGEISAEDISEYLGTFESVEFPKDEIDLKNVAVLVNENGMLVAKKIKFEIQDGKITNLESANI